MLWRRLGISIFSIMMLSYLAACGYLFVRQRSVIYYPAAQHQFTPSDPEFRLPYKSVLIPTGQSGQTIQGWWLPAPLPDDKLDLLPQEPRRVLSSPKVLLYFCGVGRNMGDYNYLTRAEALRQLGFSVLMFDYRGYGKSDGEFPNEARIYADAQAAWRYLAQTRGIPSQDIVLYGESMGGAVAIDVAVKQPQAGGLIVQSSFSSMSDMVHRRAWAKFFPIDLLLTEKFDSLRKIRHLRVPVLFIHGKRDTVVPDQMSQQLYAAAPAPKSIWLIDQGAHVAIYRPKQSYLKAIARFLKAHIPQ